MLRLEVLLPCMSYCAPLHVLFCCPGHPILLPWTPYSAALHILFCCPGHPILLPCTSYSAPLQVLFCSPAGPILLPCMSYSAAPHLLTSYPAPLHVLSCSPTRPILLPYTSYPAPLHGCPVHTFVSVGLLFPLLHFTTRKQDNNDTNKKQQPRQITLWAQACSLVPGHSHHLSKTVRALDTNNKTYHQYPSHSGIVIYRVPSSEEKQPYYKVSIAAVAAHLSSFNWRWSLRRFNPCVIWRPVQT
jgi:hypothetical protein